MTIEGKVAAFHPSLQLLSEVTGKASSPELATLHVEHYIAQGLSIDAVNETIKKLALSWTDRRWPTPEQIAILTRHRLRAGSSTLPPTDEAHEALEQAERDRTWDRRVHDANEWREHYPEIFARVVRRIDQEIATKILASPNGFLATLSEYRDAYREGAVVGACLAELSRTRDQTTLPIDRYT